MACILGLAVAAAAFVAGPPSFDAIDSTEFILAADDLSIAHPPSHSLFLMLLHLFPGRGFTSGRLLTALLGGAAAAAAFFAARLEGGPCSFRAALLSAGLMLSPPVFTQINTVEVYGTALLLVICARLARGTPAGPYLFGLSVFGGHPLNSLLAPVCIGRAWRRWWPLLSIPAGLLLFVPLRAVSPPGLNPHYTRPDTITELAAYFSLYSGRLGAFSIDGFRLMGSWTAASTAAMLALAAFARPRPSETASFVMAAAFLAFYRVPDPSGMAFPALLPVWLTAVRGAGRLASERSEAVGLAAAACCLAVSVFGIGSSSRCRDSIARTVACDMMREAPPGAVYCTIGHDTFHAAYLLSIEDRRPDILPSDTYGNYFALSLAEPFQAKLSGRPVVATRAWNSPELELSGLVFMQRDTRRSVPRLDLEGLTADSPDAFAMDLAAESYARLALQSVGETRDSLSELARSMARTAIASRRIEALLER